jgi:hypothetical protein
MSLGRIYISMFNNQQPLHCIALHCIALECIHLTRMYLIKDTCAQYMLFYKQYYVQSTKFLPRNQNTDILTWNKFISYVNYCLESGHAVAQLVEALRYKPEGRVFYSRWCHWNFSLTILPAALALGLTQPLTEMITRYIFLSVKAAGT